MKIISVNLSASNKLPLYSNFELLHDVLVEFEKHIFFIEIKAIDTIDAANKIMSMTDSQFKDLIGIHNSID